MKGVLVGGVDDVCKLAEEGNLKEQLAVAAGVGASAGASATTGQKAAAAPAGGKSIQDRCKELVKRYRTDKSLERRPLADFCGGVLGRKYCLCFTLRGALKISDP